MSSDMHILYGTLSALMWHSEGRPIKVTIGIIHLHIAGALTLLSPTLTRT